MAKCKRCGRKGLFFKVNPDGYCSNCVTLFELEEKQTQLESNISEYNERIVSLKKEINEQEQLYNEYKTKNETIYEQIKSKAEADAINKIQNRIDELEAEKSKLEKECKNLSASSKTLSTKLYNEKTLYDSYRHAVEFYIDYGENNIRDISVDDLSPMVSIDLQCMTIRQLRKLHTENKKLIMQCFYRYSERYNTKTNSSLYKLMTIALEAELQNVLYCIKFGKLDESIETIKKMCNRYYSIATDGNQHIAPTIKKFICEIETLFTESVKIEYEYYVQKERIKEEQRAIREQMRQETEERKALEQERKRMDKESTKYLNEIEKIKDQLKAVADEQAVLLQKRISELEDQLNKVEEKREQIINLENGKAGYVYIISNIGSFGEDVYKIGMTRRLEPMDRINELGNASVPFPFDVHGMIFSDDAVNLEHDLHNIFNNNRVNKINLRKEFFHVSLDEIEKIVDERCPSAEFRRTALAEQYRQSITMTSSAKILDSEDIEI